jgi:hypothetical protein
MKPLIDFLAFRSFLSPKLLQALFWAGIGGTLYGSIWLFVHDNWAWIMALVFGTIGTRLIFENMLLRFKSYEALRDIRDHLIETTAK